MNNLRMMILVGMIGLFSALVSCPAGSNSIGMGYPGDIKIYDFGFNPPVFTVAVGTPVVWINTVTTSHSATTRPSPASVESFDSGILLQGRNFSKTFSSPGTNYYWCSIHTTAMLGTVIVTN